MTLDYFQARLRSHKMMFDLGVADESVYNGAAGLGFSTLRRPYIIFTDISKSYLRSRTSQYLI